MTTAEKPAAAAPPSLGPAADRLREAARWLVIAFGAVAAVVFAGISISGFGGVDPETAPIQFWTAAGGAAGALLGVLAALLIAISLASASTISVADLRAERASRAIRKVREGLAGDPLLAPWEDDFGDFFDELDEAQLDYEVRLRNWTRSGEIEARAAFANRASDRVTSLTRKQTAILETASYLRLRRRFTFSRWWILVLLAVAAIGATAFVWATGAAATESVPEKASAATWTVPGDDRGVVDTQLGSSCTYNLDKVPVVILGEQGDGKEADIVTAARNDCQPLRLVVDAQNLMRE
ncbi:MAG TPA: hypothetical protein VGP26_25115 [Actinophytocola sp.]|jgi:hypothetical protein|nr:hypothetical protein [Actinophytocola sp.]